MLVGFSQLTRHGEKLICTTTLVVFVQLISLFFRLRESTEVLKSKFLSLIWNERTINARILHVRQVDILYQAPTFERNGFYN